MVTGKVDAAHPMHQPEQPRPDLPLSDPRRTRRIRMKNGNLGTPRLPPADDVHRLEGQGDGHEVPPLLEALAADLDATTDMVASVFARLLGVAARHMQRHNHLCIPGIVDFKMENKKVMKVTLSQAMINATPVADIPLPSTPRSAPKKKRRVAQGASSSAGHVAAGGAASSDGPAPASSPAPASASSAAPASNFTPTHPAPRRHFSTSALPDGR